MLLHFLLHNFDRTAWKINALELCLDLLLNPITGYYHKKHQSEIYWWCLFSERATVNSKYKYFNGMISHQNKKVKRNKLCFLAQQTTYFQI